MIPGHLFVERGQSTHAPNILLENNCPKVINDQCRPAERDPMAETSDKLDLAGAILAGGRSCRMGQPKEGILLRDGRPMIEHVAEALSPVCSEIIILGDCRGYHGELLADASRLPDRVTCYGPLAGLDALLASGIAKRYLVVSCDQPLLTPVLLGDLASSAGRSPAFFRSTDGEEFDPFPGIYPESIQARLEFFMAMGERSVRRFLRKGPLQWITLADEDRPQLRTMNSAEDLRECELLG